MARAGANSEKFRKIQLTFNDLPIPAPLSSTPMDRLDIANAAADGLGAFKRLTAQIRIQFNKRADQPVDRFLAPAVFGRTGGQGRNYDQEGNNND